VVIFNNNVGATAEAGTAPTALTTTAAAKHIPAIALTRFIIYLCPSSRHWLSTGLGAPHPRDQFGPWVSQARGASEAGHCIRSREHLEQPPLFQRPACSFIRRRSRDVSRLIWLRSHNADKAAMLLLNRARFWAHLLVIVCLLPERVAEGPDILYRRTSATAVLVARLPEF
jgi:hypothetical protein